MATTTPTKPLRVLRLPDVEAKTGLSVPDIYKRMNKNEFPLSIVLGPNMRGWIEAELDLWIEERIRARDEGTDEREFSSNIAKGRRDREKASVCADDYTGEADEAPEPPKQRAARAKPEINTEEKVAA